MKPQDRKILTRLLANYVRPDEKILEVGCGVGNNLDFLASLGFRNIAGVDISPEMVSASVRRGHHACTVDAFHHTPFTVDVLLFSHVLEHIEYRELQPTLEFYCAQLRSNGRAIIVAPVMYDAFWVDVDHLKPYYPAGIINLFSDRDISRQYQSRFQFTLLDLHYRKESLLPYHLRCRFLPPGGSLRLKLLAAGFTALQYCSANLLAKTTGYGAIFEVTERYARQHQPANH